MITKWHLVVILVVLSVLVFGGAIFAQGGPAEMSPIVPDTPPAPVQLSVFSAPDLVARAIDQDPARAVAIMGQVLTQEVADQLEAALIPPATDAEKTAAIDRCKAELKRAGLDKDATITAPLEAARAALAPVAVDTGGKLEVKGIPE